MNCRWTPVMAAAALAAAALILPATAVAGSDPGVANPNSSAHGSTHAEWLMSYWRFHLTGEESEDGAKNNVEMLPMAEAELLYTLPDGTNIVGGHLDLTLDEGDAFVVPIVAYIGRGMPDGTEEASVPDWVFTDLIAPTVEVLLDGDELIEDAADYYTGEVDYDPVIEFDELDDEGYDSVVFLLAMGIVVNALPPGEYSLSKYVEIPVAGFGLYHTWTITVGE